MAEWFATARNTLRRDRTGAAPASFERPCLCGERLVGQRDESPHSIVCGRCQRSWFVLPRDVYPWPKSRKQKQKRKLRSSRKTTAPEQQPEQAAKLAVAADSTVSSQSRPETSVDAKTASPSEPVLTIGPSWIERVKSRLRRGARPIRLIITGILLLVLLTSIWLWRRARVREAAATLVASVPAAEAAIDQGNLPLAEESLARAVGALDILDAEDATARRIRQRHRELLAITKLASLAPYDLAVEAQMSARNPQRWSSRFATMTAGQWVILDVPLGAPRPATADRLPSKPTESAEEEKENKESEAKRPPAAMVIPLELPLLAGTTPVRLELEAERFENLSSLPRAIIAAQYVSWRLMTDSAGQPVWVVRFNPETSFAWTSGDLYEAAGFDLDDPILSARQQLAKQAKILGVAKE